MLDANLKSCPFGRGFATDVWLGTISVFGDSWGSLPPFITSATGKLRNQGSSSSSNNNNNKDWSRSVLTAILPPCAASLSFFCNLALAQGAGRIVRVSCTTPVVGPVLGGLAVAAASAASAQVSFTVRRLCEDGRLKRIELISQERALFYALFGLVAFKVLGGTFRNVMPSNVTRPGAHARSSIPARGIKYANDVEAGLVKDLFKRYGCHHCGNKKGPTIADHMPANMIAKQAMTRNFFSKFFRRPKPIAQRLYPQCLSCSQIQSSALRHGNQPLVFHYHRGFPQPPAWTGFCIGALQLQDDGKQSHYPNSY